MNPAQDTVPNPPPAAERLKRRSARGRYAFVGLALVLGIAGHVMARAQTVPVSIPDKSFPESLSSTRGGTLYVGSLNLGGVVKVAPDGKAEQFIPPGAAASRSVLGVLADEQSGTLYVCSNDMTGIGVPGPTGTKGAQLKTFDLHTGVPKGSFAFHDVNSMCNDIAVGPDGAAYATDSFAPNVYRLNPDGTAFEVWATDPLLAPAKDGVGLDGIAFGPDGNLYVTQFIPAALFRIAVTDGKAGRVTALKASRALDRTDGMRPFGDGFLLIEGGGRLDKVTIKGDAAEIETIQDGFVEPVGVTVVGNTGWVAEGKSSFLFGSNKGKDPGPFTVKPVALPK
jgi:sugar lactone lactonase YvrE